jgi:hypothetical protein
MARYILIGYEGQVAEVEARRAAGDLSRLPPSETEYERKCKLQLSYPRTPGQEPAVHALARDVDSAAEYKRELLARRRDLIDQDVRIEVRGSGRRVA